MLQKYLNSIKKTRQRFFIETALKMGIKVEIVSENFRILKFSDGKKSNLLYKEQFFFNKKPSIFFAKNKEITKILLGKEGLSVPSGIFAKNYGEAVRLIKKKGLNFPLVAKPIDAAKGLGVTLNITSFSELKKAISKIQRLTKKITSMECSGEFIVETMKKGNDFRVLVLNNKVVGCIQRIPAYLIGDGKNNIERLIEIFNKTRPISYKIKIDKELLKKIAMLNLDLSSILKKNQRVQLRDNANISSGGKAIDKTPSISPRFTKIATRAANALGLNFAGIDVMTADIASNNLKQPYFIIEINGAPDYDIHEKPIVSGKGVKVTELLVKEFIK